MSASANLAAVEHALSIDNLSAQPAERLAEAHNALRELQAQLKEIQGRLDSELRIRLRERDRKLMLFGDWEVALEGSNESVWDADELELALRELVDQGTLSAGELTGLIKRDPVVDRTAANRLVGRLVGNARDMVEQCRTWRQKGQPRVRVTRSAQLTSENERQEITP